MGYTSKVTAGLQVAEEAVILLVYSRCVQSCAEGEHLPAGSVLCLKTPRLPSTRFHSVRLHELKTVLLPGTTLVEPILGDTEHSIRVAVRW